MDVLETRKGDVLVLTPAGALDEARACTALQDKLTEQLDSGSRLIVVDCHKVGQVGSAALRVLLTAKRKLIQSGGSLALCGLNTKVRQAFEISGFDGDFTIVGTEEEAVQTVVRAAAAALGQPQPAPAREVRVAALVYELLGQAGGRCRPRAVGAQGLPEKERLAGLALAALAARPSSKAPATPTR